MADPLIHSMKEFHDIIDPAIKAAGARAIVEIGSEFARMS